MSIIPPVNLRLLSQEEFRQLDYAVMRLAFDCQNDLGRLCDEEAYQRLLAARIVAAGLGSARLEERIEVVFETFRRWYDIDLVVSDGAIYELKAVSVLAGEHVRQLLTYLMLCEQPRGKLVNFRAGRIETEFVNSPLTLAERLQFRFQVDGWHVLSERCDWLRDLMHRLLSDWGAFLEIPLYVNAITHFLGGESVVQRQVPLSRDGIHLGLQEFHLLTDDIAFRITAFRKDQANYQSQLARLLSLTDLRAVQWINMNHHDIEFVTVMKAS